MARIIYVEDDELIGELVRDTLIDAGHGVGVIADGRTALDVFKRKLPDLVILDIGLPEMGGMDVLYEMRRDTNLYGIPVLMLTGRRGAGDEAIAFHAGATEYLRKPFDPDQLIVIVEDLLSKHKKATGGQA